MKNAIDFDRTTLWILEYWRIGLETARDFPFTGKGPDSYIEGFRLYRGSEFVGKYSQDVISDSAHNVFLDFFANGGIPLGCLFLAISIYPAIKILLKVLKSSEEDRVGILLLAMWAAYQLQAFVSVNQLGVATDMPPT